MAAADQLRTSLRAKNRLSGSAPRCRWNVRRFSKRLPGITLIEGYGLDRSDLPLCRRTRRMACVKWAVSASTFPYTDVRSFKKQARGLSEADAGRERRNLLSNPGVFAGNTYTEADKNIDLYYQEQIPAHRGIWAVSTATIPLDARAVQRPDSSVVRHNIDPAEIEEAFAGSRSGGLCCAIVNRCPRRRGALRLVESCCRGSVTEAELLSSAKSTVQERAAQPKAHDDHERTAQKPPFGKNLQPDLRKKRHPPASMMKKRSRPRAACAGLPLFHRR